MYTSSLKAENGVMS